MPTYRVSPEHPEPHLIEQAARHLQAGRLVAFPTETVYGLGAHAMDPDAVARIYEAKGRPAWNPLIVHVATVDDVHGVAAEWPGIAQQLADAFWPGPLTLVVPKRPGVPDAVTAGLPSVAVRVPAHAIAHALLVAAGLPVAAPSANRSTALSPTRAEHVERALGDRVSMILDGGASQVGIESTVIDLSAGRPRLLRPGGIALRDLEAVVGPLEGPGHAPREGVARQSPGMMDRHYAPRARVALFGTATTSAIRDAIEGEKARGGRVGVVLWSEHDHSLAVPAALEVRLPGEPVGYASSLYATLHRLDEQGCTLVAVETPPDEPGWEAVHDRLRRASTQ